MNISSCNWDITETLIRGHCVSELDYSDSGYLTSNLANLLDKANGTTSHAKLTLLFCTSERQVK